MNSRKEMRYVRAVARNWEQFLACRAKRSDYKVDPKLHPFDRVQKVRKIKHKLGIRADDTRFDSQILGNSANE